MAGKTLDINTLLYDRDYLATAISLKYDEWQIYRQAWLAEKKELRNYLFATDTRSTTNSKLPWKNSTTTPKLTQIRDNLHANYLAALFPGQDWLEWEGNSESDETAQKKEAIENYMQTKIRQDNAESVFSRLLLDYIDYGNVFATVDWADESVALEDGTIQRGYVGPRFRRISPYDIVFNPIASRFEDSPKIVRALKDLGEIAQMVEKLEQGEKKRQYERVLNRGIEIRRAIRDSKEDTYKGEGFLFDGFSDIQQYFSSDMVEILTFYGDIFDIHRNKLLKNYKIVIIDRAWVIEESQNTDWVAGSGIFHAGWRLRPDNLYAMGPLDNLVGMQYRIDHLENIKADAYDLIAYPIQKVTGSVDDYTYQPGERIYVGEEGDVDFMRTDLSSIVSADNQIETLMFRMEELAGAPREAMGFRTPGEKTKFEVQILDNAAQRVFLNKTEQFEKEFLTKLLNYGIGLARQNMSAADVIRTLDSEVEAVVFATITKDDLVANGILRPVGASHFARKANILQNIVNLSNTPLMQDPSINVHISGKKIAKLIEELAELEDFKLYSENIRVIEQAETQRMIDGSQERIEQARQTPSELSPSGL